MMRGVTVVDQAVEQSTKPAVLVTHGNLLTLILKHFDEQIGYAVWENLQNPDVYCLKFNSSGTNIEQIEIPKTNENSKQN
jgi:2,3-bisphosphoglycerate-dependent phosphoglycerate mutase